MMRKISLIIFILVFSSSCSNSEAPLDKKFWLDFNATRPITDTPLTLSFIDINDSRCPLGLECVWEGKVIVTLLASHEESEKTITQAIELTLNATKESTSTVYKNYAIILSSVIPKPNANAVSKKDDYKIEVTVKQADQRISDINWQLTHFELVEEFGTHFGGYVDFTLLLSPDSYQATGSSACKNWSSTFELGTEQIKFKNTVSTDISCSAESRPEPALIQNIFTNATAYSMQDDIFTIKTSNDSQFHFVNVAAAQNAFEKAYKLWQKVNIQHYSFTYYPSCYNCTNGPIHIEVKDGLIVEAFYEDQFESNDMEFEDLRTIDELFEEISWAIDMPAYSIDISYSHTFGFPDDGNILYNYNIVHSSSRYSVRNFLPLP